MFKSLRWRLTVWFVLLSMLVYATVVALGVFSFHAGLTAALDDELQELSLEILPTVDYDGEHVRLRHWPTRLHKEPIKLLASIQLFDWRGHLVQEYGQKGIGTLFPGKVEVNQGGYSKRCLTTPLINDGKGIGFLQVQVPTKLRDTATRQFVLTMAVIAPLLLLSLGVCGYFFSGKAAKPVEETFSVLRQFLADVGHELGTPIAIIQAAAENLSLEFKDDNSGTDRLSIISRSCERMSRLVEDLMLLARMEAPQPSDRQSPVQLDRLLKGAVQEFADRFKDRNIDLQLVDVSPAVVTGDQDSLYRMVGNLLENALRYTMDGGKVTVSLRSHGRTARLAVEDTGIGILPESLGHIFDRFYRVDKSRSRAAGGSGLGLSIVKAIVESHRGTVEVASEAGHGSKFTVVLPCSN